MADRWAQTRVGYWDAMMVARWAPRRVASSDSKSVVRRAVKRAHSSVDSRELHLAGSWGALKAAWLGSHLAVMRAWQWAASMGRWTVD
jgi:hypothetical protein